MRPAPAPSRPDPTGRRASAALLTLLLLAEIALAALPVLARAPSQTAEAIAETRLRAEPSQRSEPLLRLAAGATLTIYGKPEQGWYRAQHGRLKGYVRSGDVATAPLAASSGRHAREAVDDPRAVELEQRARGQRDDNGKRDRKPGGNGNKESRKAERKRAKKEQRKQDRRAQRSDSTGIRTSADLNLRQEPDESAEVRVVVPRGERVEPTGEQRDGWVELMWQDQRGWVLGRFLSTSRPMSLKRDRDDTTWSRQELKEIIFAAADRYGQPREDMLRVARCESDLVPTAVNEHGGSYGLFQFKPGTWLGTPYAEYDIFDPRPNAYAAAWMWSEGRRREWVCQ